VSRLGGDICELELFSLAGNGREPPGGPSAEWMVRVAGEPEFERVEVSLTSTFSPPEQMPDCVRIEVVTENGSAPKAPRMFGDWRSDVRGKAIKDSDLGLLTRYDHDFLLRYLKAAGYICDDVMRIRICFEWPEVPGPKK